MTAYIKDIDLDSRNGLRKLPEFPSRMFNGLLTEVIFPLIHSYGLYNQLFLKSEEIINLLNATAPFCFWQFQLSMFKDIVLNISILMDKDSSSSSIKNIMDIIKKNLRTKEDHTNYEILEREYKELLFASKDIVEYRHNAVAHKSYKELYVHKTLVVFGFDYSMTIILRMMKFILKYFGGEIMKYWQIEETVEKQGASVLVTHLKQSIEYQKLQ